MRVPHDPRAPIVRLESPISLGLLLLLVAALAGPSQLSACASSGTTASSDASAGAEAVTITAALPKDAAAEPPWNGRFVQVSVSGPSPEKMAASDWSVFVERQEAALAKPPDILPSRPTRRPWLSCSSSRSGTSAIPVPRRVLAGRRPQGRAFLALQAGAVSLN